MRTICALVIATAVSIGLNAQTHRADAAKPRNSAVPASKAALSEKQKIGLNLLESAEGAARALESRSQVAAYTNIAMIYKATDQRKALELIERAYESARTLSTDSSDNNEVFVNQQLQQHVVDQFIVLSPAKVDALLDQMPRGMRENALQGLLAYYWKTNNLDRPVNVLREMAMEGEMPYGLAATVIEKLGTQHPESVQELFVASLTSFQNHAHLGVSSGGFTQTIAAAYKHVPDQLVGSAIDEVLSQAKKADEEQKKRSIQMSFGSNQPLEFKSAYDLQLFSVLPILQQIDPEKADRLASERQDVKTFAAKYPREMEGLRETGFQISINDAGENQGTGSIALEQRRASEIIDSAVAHPNDALANAALLPPGFALQAYLGIARKNLKKNSTAAATALRKAQELLPRAQTIDQVSTVADIVYLYEQLGDKDAARSAISAGVKTANAFYRQDTDPSDPNTAPEAYWISTSVWRRLIDAAYELDPSTAISLVDEVPDDAMRVFAQIAIEKRLLGSSAITYEMSMSVHKNGDSWIMFTSAPVPVQ